MVKLLRASKSVLRRIKGFAFVRQFALDTGKLPDPSGNGSVPFSPNTVCVPRAKDANPGLARTMVAECDRRQIG
jgi:hypothetical protein